MTAIEIDTGEFLVAVACPHCGREAEVPAVIEQVLKVKGTEGSLSVALSAKAVPHDCKQEQLTFGEEITLSVGMVDRETGEIHEASRGVRL